MLYRVGRALTGDDMEGRTLADSLYGDLYGDGPGTQDEHNTRTLFRYYDGRSTLATWLRAILAQRYVDHYRTNRRLVPAEDTALERQTVVAAPTLAGSPDTIRHLAVIHSALRQALADTSVSRSPTYGLLLPAEHDPRHDRSTAR